MPYVDPHFPVEPALNELEYLRKYEPVLRFAKSERFFPMDAERYLEYCRIFPSSALTLPTLVNFYDIPLVQMLGKLERGEYFLRFVNNPFSSSDAWVGLGVLSLVGLGIGWFLLGLLGIEIVVLLAALAALIIFMQASPIRLRIFPAVFAAIIFIALEVLPVRFFLTPHTVVSSRTEYLILLPIYLLALFYFSVRTMKFIFDHIIPEAPGVIMDMLSAATERVAKEAFLQYCQILEKDPQPVYYGRVVNETDRDGNHWRILQYHFFYAFNEWRLAANGMNHHEGDWEMVAVYLKNDQPYSVLYSQHGEGAMELWRNAYKTVDQNGETTHPLIYVALGSHANYSTPDVIQSPQLYKAGFAKRFLYWLDGILRFVFLFINPDERARQKALQQLTAQRIYHSFKDAEQSVLNLRDETDHYLVSLPMEIPTGDGFRIGLDGNSEHEPSGYSSSYLKRVMSDRKVVHPGERLWRPVLFPDGHGWLEYKGLWGVKSLLENESGPPGPKWDRPGKDQSIRPRKRWEKPLAWLAELEELEQKKIAKVD